MAGAADARIAAVGLLWTAAEVLVAMMRRKQSKPGKQLACSGREPGALVQAQAAPEAAEAVLARRVQREAAGQPGLWEVGDTGAARVLGYVALWATLEQLWRTWHT